MCRPGASFTAWWHPKEHSLKYLHVYLRFNARTVRSNEQTISPKKDLKPFLAGLLGDPSRHGDAREERIWRHFAAHQSGQIVLGDPDS